MTIATSTMPPSVAALPSGSQLPTGANGLSSAQTLTEANFFQLLTAQLEHQDPLNPMTGDEFAAELAQFSTASGVQSLQTTSTNQQAVGLVGHSVAVSGNTLPLAQSGGSASGAFDLSAAATDVTVTIADSTGKTVASLDLGAMPAGTSAFTWNGRAADGSAAAAGTYGFSLSATGTGGAAVAATPYTVVPVTAVVLGGQNGPLLELGGGATPIALSAVQQIF
jgi:flagellar basal-body rod modification protein FlgD